MRPQEIIRKKRDGEELGEKDIAEFVHGVCDGSWADYQTAALLMAIFINGLNEREGSALVREMLQSGEVLDFSDINKPKADKHSTGGVGDKTSLIIAPLVASCGVAVPMISGRGLGHTGGTLDKLESIPGYNVGLSTDEFCRVIDACGFGMVGQTADIAPADKKIYALRDATATVPYIPLIVASIMSKKLAEGLDALVLDVKTGSGAFMKSQEDAAKLAASMVRVGEEFGVRTEAVISDMSQPLGKHVGNACEVFECINILRNEIEPAAMPTWELSRELSARMLVLSGVASSIDDARSECDAKLNSGEVLEFFRRNVELQGGDASVCDQPDKLLDVGVRRMDVLAQHDGYLSAVDTFAVGETLVEIGGGRSRAEDVVDHCVGLSSDVKIGDKIEKGQPIASLYCRTAEHFAAVNERISTAYKITDEEPAGRSMILDTVAP